MKDETQTTFEEMTQTPVEKQLVAAQAALDAVLADCRDACEAVANDALKSRIAAVYAGQISDAQHDFNAAHDAVVNETARHTDIGALLQRLGGQDVVAILANRGPVTVSLNQNGETVARFGHDPRGSSNGRKASGAKALEQPLADPNPGGCLSEPMSSKPRAVLLFHGDIFDSDTGDCATRQWSVNEIVRWSRDENGRDRPVVKREPILCYADMSVKARIARDAHLVETNRDAMGVKNPRNPDVAKLYAGRSYFMKSADARHCVSNALWHSKDIEEQLERHVQPVQLV